MICPNCGKRDMAMMQALEALVALPADHDRLWCPMCGWVLDQPIAKKVVLQRAKKVAAKAEKAVPRGTSVAKRVLKGAKGRSVQKGGRK